MNMSRSNNLIKPLHFKNPRLMVQQWYAADLGQALLEKEKQHLQQLLEQIFGYNLVQLGCLDKSKLVTQYRTSHHYVLESEPVKNTNNTHIVSDFSQLAVQNHSVDAVILPHTLEFSAHPHQILREVERILIAEGKAVFLGFNPYSLWGLWHKYWELKSRVFANNKDADNSVPLPSCGHLISPGRLQDWLKLLGFDVELVSEYFYRPPVRNSVLLKQLEFMEQAGQLSKLLPAGAYILIASKRVSTLTPVRQSWKFRKSIIASDTVGAARFKTNREKKG